MPDVYFDESIVERFETDTGGGEAGVRRIGRRLLVGAVVVPDGHSLEQELHQRAGEVLADPLAWAVRGTAPGGANRRQVFAQDHFHFTVDSDRIRGAALEVMLAHEFRAHVFYSHLTDPNLRLVDVQTAMYFTLVRTLLQRYAGEHLALTFENEQRMNTQYARIVLHALNSLDRDAPKKPRQARATVAARRVGKPNGGVSTVDYCLGVVNHGLQEAYQDSRTPVQAFRLETLGAVDAHIAHVAYFDSARHRRRFDIVNSPGWARHIAGANSHSGVTEGLVTSIGGDPTGPFDFVRDVRSLAAALGKTPDALSEARRLAQDRAAYEFHRIKVRGKWRQLTQPTAPELDGALRRLLDFMNPLNSRLHPGCSAYVPGRSCVHAAAPHAGHEWIQKLDIKSFFRSTTRRAVMDVFMWLGATVEVAEAIADLTTFRNQLTTGARTSPLVSNLILTRFDQAVASEASRQHLTYTRYADDMIFSGDARFDMSDEVTTALAPLGYRINQEKTVIRRRGQPLKIAGLTVFELDAPRLPKPVKRKLRLELFLVNKAMNDGFEGLSLDAEDPAGDAEERLARILGLYRYARSIEPDWAERLLSKLPAARDLINTPASDTVRRQSVSNLVMRIAATNAPSLTATLLQIGPPAPLDPS